MCITPLHPQLFTRVYYVLDVLGQDFASGLCLQGLVCWLSVLDHGILQYRRTLALSATCCSKA